MARRYLIGDVSRILGLARETLRYYERCGIVVPWKDPETGYRYYDPVQINHLMLCKMYRQMGMSSAEICDLIDREGSRREAGTSPAQVRGAAPGDPVETDGVGGCGAPGGTV